ncbi:MAG: hypothetical protein PHD67_00150 [Oscillospiraceae bacterium]|nr:hypothetical protein [Oscillospiraceae bacterium]
MEMIFQGQSPDPKEKYKEYQALLCKLPGVLNAQFVLDEDGSARELHILSTLAKSPKQLARDVQSALLAAFSFPLDHRVISIAQIDTGDRSLLPCPQRLACEQVTLTVGSDAAQCRVSLSLDKEVYVGESSSSGLIYSRQRMVAEAALMSIHRFLGRPDVFSLVDVRQSEVAARPAVLVTVGYSENGADRLLLGAVYLEDDVNTAIVKATLDAVNRRLSLCVK